MATIKVRKYKNSIYVIYSHRNRRFKIFTGAKVDDKYWNISSLKRSCPDYNILKSQIDAMENQVLNASIALRQRGLDPMPDLVRRESQLRVASVLEKPDVRSTWQKYDDYLAQLVCRASSKRKIGMTYKVMDYFCKWSSYQFDSKTFNKQVFGRMIHYLLVNQKLHDSTVQKHAKLLKTFFSFSFPEQDWSWVKYSPLKTEAEVIALTEAELKQLMGSEVPDHLIKTRDLFVFMATTGMRHCDSQLFEPSWETPEKVLEFTQLKTGGKAYPPIYGVAQAILEKYQGLPPLIINQHFNRNLKVLFKELKFNRKVVVQLVRGKEVFRTSKPLHEVISSHTARRTFISICLQKNMPIQVVMKMSGHSDYKSMRPYISIKREQIRDVANLWDI